MTDTPQTTEPRWHALWTHSHCEQLVHDQLVQKGFEAFLPMIDVWSRRRGVRHLISAPMFPGYLFLRHAVDKTSYSEVGRTRGVVRMLGERWDRPELIPEGEMDTIVKVVTARQPVLPYPYLKEGQRARVSSGPLTGLEGILVRAKPEKGLLVLFPGPARLENGAHPGRPGPHFHDGDATGRRHVQLLVRIVETPRLDCC